ncbi:class I SAM-dependent methyltransferase [Microbacterium sp.]|uniref:class I SAM-dependent methyltransferase n=1 Tax=Microbacterium sp. TaxID=51671 RepID=UPI0028114D4A|nr:class I SAM-dependent methyltransferase [Microbacterium sp.]
MTDAGAVGADESSADAAVAAAYDDRAKEYIALGSRIDQMDSSDRGAVARWRDGTSGVLLDAGCGPGHWTAFLHDGHRDVVGIDLSARLLARARAEYPHLSFAHGSFRHLPFAEESIGGILAWYSLIHLPPADVPGVLVEFARVLAPGGGLLLGFFDGEAGESFEHAVAPAWFWSADALDALLRDAGFAPVSGERRDRGPGEMSRRPHGAVTATLR